MGRSIGSVNRQKPVSDLAASVTVRSAKLTNEERRFPKD